MSPRVLIGRPHAPDSATGPGPTRARDVRFVYDRQGGSPSIPIGLLWRVTGGDDDGTAEHYEWTPGTPVFPAPDGTPGGTSYQYVRTFRAWLAAALPQEVAGA